MAGMILPKPDRRFWWRDDGHADGGYSWSWVPACIVGVNALPFIRGA